MSPIDGTAVAAPEPESRKEGSTERILQMVKQNHQIGKVSTRRVLYDQLGNLPFTTLDDRLKHLCNVGQLRRPENGVYEPTDDLAEERAVVVLVLPTGRVKVEIGDCVLLLSQREARNLGALCSGFALQFRG